MAGEYTRTSSREETDRIEYASSCMKGPRDEMQDYHTAILELDGSDSTSSFGVFDGHGGDKGEFYCSNKCCTEVVKDPDCQNNPCVAVEHLYFRKANPTTAGGIEPGPYNWFSLYQSGGPWLDRYDIRNTVTYSLNGSPMQIARSYDESVLHVLNWFKLKGTEISYSSVLGRRASLFTTCATGTFHFLTKYELDGVIHAANLIIDAFTGWCYGFVNAKGIWLFKPRDPDPYIQHVGMMVIPVEGIYAEISPDGLVKNIEIGIDASRESCITMSEYDGSTDPTELKKLMIAVGRAIFPVCEGCKFNQVYELNRSVLQKGVSTTIENSENPETALCVKGWDKICTATNSALFHYLLYKIPMWPFKFNKDYGRIKTVEQALKYINIAPYKSVNTRMAKRLPRLQCTWSRVDDGDGDKDVSLLRDVDLSRFPVSYQQKFKQDTEFFLGDRVSGRAHWTVIQFLGRKKPSELNPYRGSLPITYGDKAPSHQLTKNVRHFNGTWPAKLARAIRLLKR